jgi:hypothetical protein
MSQLDSRRVEWDGVQPFGLGIDQARGNEDKFRFGINEPLDQPWTGYAVDVDMGACDPFHLAFLSLYD